MYVCYIIQTTLVTLVKVKIPMEFVMALFRNLASLPKKENDKLDLNFSIFNAEKRN